MTQKKTVSSAATTSVATVENHTPSMPQTSGNVSTAATSNTTVRRNEIAAEVTPSLSAVKNDEP